MQFVGRTQLTLPINFWIDTMDLNSGQTVILAYFYTSPYNNLLGCFYYPFDKTAGDLDYDQNKGIIDSSIEKNAFVDGDAKRKWIYLPHYLKYFPIRNSYQGKHIEKLFYHIPWGCSFYADLVLRLLCISNLSDSFCKYLRKGLFALIKKQVGKKIMDYYSLEAEQAGLGGILFDNTVWPLVQEQLSSKDFYRREHQVLFDLISKKLEQGDCVDALSLSNEVKTIPELKEINGEIYVFELLRQTYSVANILTYVGIVKERAQKRQFKEILNYLDEHSKESDVKTLVKQAYQELEQLSCLPLPQHHDILYKKFMDKATSY